VISIIVFSFVTSENNLVKVLSRIVLIPVIASISYELLKLSGKYRNNWFVKMVSAPGLMIQNITTKEPDNKQIEVAVHALKLVVKEEEKA
jgi:uncharacterized protein YqhQ